MLLVITERSEERKFVKEHFDECMEVFEKKLLRSDKPVCYRVAEELAKMYLEKMKEKDTAIVLLLGNEELLGLRLLLT